MNLLGADATGGANLLAHQTLGLFSLGTNPTNGKTITLTINTVAVTITFVSAIGSTPGNVLIAGTAAGSVSNLLNLLANPQVTNANQVALSSANQTLVGYLDYDQSGGTLAVSSVNNLTYAPLTSFTAATNITGDTWTPSTMMLYVEDGICFINGVEVYFTGHMTPLVTAPVSHPRIDLLTIDNTGTLAWVTGVEGTSPATPAYPNNKLVICELWNVVGETQLLDNLNQSATQGFIYNDARPFLQNMFMPLNFPSAIIPDGDGTHDLGSASFEWGNIYAKNGIFLGGVSINSQITTGLTAGPNFTQAQAAVAAPYQSDGGILLDNKLTSTTTTTSFIVGSNSNRVLIVTINTNTSGATCSGITYNGVAMTLVDSISQGSNGFLYSFILIAPATGTHNLVATVSAGTPQIAIWSFYNAAQTSQPEAHASAETSSGTTSSLNTVARGALVVSAFGTTSTISGNGAYNDLQNTAGGMAGGDSGQVFTAGTSITVSITNSASAVAVVQLSIAPFTAVADVAQLASSATPTNNQFNNRHDAFLGFAASPITANTLGTFITNGVATGFSGLTPGSQYYLNDTPGTVGKSPGTNTRKVGIAVSATTMLITNIW